MRSSLAPPIGKRGVRRRDDEAAAGQVRRHQVQERVLRGRVEGRGGLVQEPKGAVRHEKAGEGHPPTLAGRQIGDREAGRVGEADGIQGLARRQGGVAEHVAARRPGSLPP